MTTNRGDLYLVEDDYQENDGLSGLGGSALVGESGNTSVDYSNIGTSAAQGASAGAVAGPYGALIGGVAGGLLGTTQDVLAIYQTDDNARNAVDSYMNAHKSDTPPNVLPSAPLYMNKWVWIIGSSVVAVAIGSVAYSMYRKKHKARRVA